MIHVIKYYPPQTVREVLFASNPDLFKLRTEVLDNIWSPQFNNVNITLEFLYKGFNIKRRK